MLPYVLDVDLSPTHTAEPVHYKPFLSFSVNVNVGAEELLELRHLRATPYKVIGYWQALHAERDPVAYHASGKGVASVKRKNAFQNWIRSTHSLVLAA
jgi:hypothetical protein